MRVSFVYANKSMFVERDLEILNEKYTVDEVTTKERFKGIDYLHLVVSLFSSIIRADIVFSWFGGVHSFFSVLLSKLVGVKTIIIIGGYEVASVPEFKYGGLRKFWKRNMVRFIFENANYILVVDEGLKRDAVANLGVTNRNIEVIPTGYDYNKIKRGNKEKEEKVLTVALMASGRKKNIMKLKGIDTFIESASLLPKTEFIVVGAEREWKKRLKNLAPNNVKIIGTLPFSKLLKYYQKAKVYCQLSLREGLPNSLSEAMLCECIPVGTNTQGVKTAIGDTGFLVPYGDSKKTANAIQKALQTDNGKKARKRIKKNFSIERRRKKLHNLIKNISNSSTLSSNSS